MADSSAFEWGELSAKQGRVLTWWQPENRMSAHEIIIADGSVRSGKTLAMSTSFILWAMSDFSGCLFGMAGKTIGSFRKNVLRDLKKVLAGEGYAVRDRRADNLLEISKNGVANTFEIFGGKDEASQDLIQGRTLAGLLLDEATLMPRSFVDQAMARCSVDGSRIWMNCNPAGPFHWLKTDFIDSAGEKNLLHIHFDLDDNKTLSDRIKSRLRSLYTGLFYKRYILGLWVMAAGIIYDMFDRSRHVIDAGAMTFRHYIVSIDYGTNNPCTFGFYGYNFFAQIVLIKEYYYDSAKEGKQKTDGEYADDLEEFIKDCKVEKIYCDPSAASFIAELKRRGLPVYQAENDVLEGIRLVAEKLTNDGFLIDRGCIKTIEEFESYSWDTKAQKRGEDKPIKEHDHAMDRNRYALYSLMGGNRIISGARIIG